MEFLGKLGIDSKLLVAQIVNFGLLLWLLTKLLYKPIINRILKEENNLAQVQKRKKDLEQQAIIFAEQQKTEIAKTKKQTRSIIKEAENIAVEVKKRARQEAEQEKQAVIKQIKARLLEIDNEEKSKQKKE